MSKNEQIKNLYSQLSKKGEFIGELATALGKSKKYLTNYWFPSCDITEKHQDEVLNFIKAKVESQKLQTA
jgi:hypothetical protein